MIKIKHWIIVLFVLVALILFIVNLSDKTDAQLETINTSVPTYKSDHSDTLVYNSKGVLNYRLVAQHLEYFSDQEISWFIQPIIIIFNTNIVPIWLIKSDRLKLTNDRMLYLYGHVEVNALNMDAQFRKITMDNAQINLVTQDVISQDLVTLDGIAFHSSSLRMHGNLRTKNAELTEKVRTYYEIKKKQTQS